MDKIIVENLKYKYPMSDTLALNDISLQIKEGEFIGLIGQNGAGKSTLCQSFVGLVPHFHKGAYGGKVLIDDMEVKNSDVSTLSTKVGIVFQNPFTQVTGSKLTVYEEIAFGLENLGLSKDEMVNRIDSALNTLDIYSYKDRSPFDLSGGQMQRVAIASIIAMRPEIIILDEPTSQLDPQGSEEVFKAIQNLSTQGITIIMVEHKIEKIAKYSDRVLLLHKGSLIDFDTPEKIFSRDDLESYGVTSPAFTKICKSLNIKNKDTGLYPITMEEAYDWVVNHNEQEKHTKTARTCDIVKFGPLQAKQTFLCHKISIQDLHFSYTDNEEILKGISLDFDNRSTAIIGQNGAGKTTFVKLLKGLLKPSSGEIYIHSKNTKSTTAAKLSKGISLVFQNPNDQIFKNKVIDEVMFGPINIGLDKEKAVSNSKEALKQVGLYEKCNENPYDLNLSERKLISIASIIAMDTDIIIFDEPTIAQDYLGKEKIKDIIKNLSSKDKLVITITHDMDFVAETFERTIVFSNGKVLLDGNTREVYSHNEVLQKAYLEPPHVTQLCEKLGYTETFLTVEEFIQHRNE